MGSTSSPTLSHLNPSLQLLEDDEQYGARKGASEGDGGAEAKALPEPAARFWTFRRAILVMLIIGYTGTYFLRTSVSVATPALLEEEGLTKSEFGIVLSIGYGFYALGKVGNGIIIDYVGGRPIFLIDLFLASVTLVFFTFFSGKALLGYTLCWGLSRFFQAGGWSSALKILSNWYSKLEAGRAVGYMSFSYMMGDAFVRLLLGVLLNQGLSWREIIYVACSIAGAIVIPCFFILKESPKDIGEDTFLADKEDNEAMVARGSIWEHVKPFLSSTRFWALGVEEMCLTVIRETFNSWLTVFFTEALELSDGDASIASLVFPLTGTISAILGGFLMDRASKGNRGWIPIIFVIPLSFVLVGLTVFTYYYADGGKGDVPICLILVSLTALFLIGPYSFPHGVFSMHMGGKKSVGFLSSVMGAFGYTSSIASGYVTGALADTYGWYSVFVFLSGLSVICLGACFAFLFFDRRHESRELAKLNQSQSSSEIEPLLRKNESEAV